jgi:hypothetical protein
MGTSSKSMRIKTERIGNFSGQDMPFPAAPSSISLYSSYSLNSLYSSH